jgi:uncharacterized protein YndB with AHSA1/START domain
MERFKINKSIDIKAPSQRVWEVLLNPELFAKWASEFSPDPQIDSQMNAEWRMGGNVEYTDKEGSGMRGKVVEFKPNEIVAVEYSSILEAFKERADDEGWKGCREIYRLAEKNGSTHLEIESDVPTREFFDEFNGSWDKALVKIKELAESKQKPTLGESQRGLGY